MMKRLFLSAALLMSVSAFAESETSNARFSWYSCYLSTSPRETFRGRGRRIEEAKQDALTQCLVEHPDTDLCQTRLQDGNYQCQLNPGWDW